MSTSVAIVTQDDPFYLPLFFDSFFQSLPDDVTIESVYLLDSFGDSLPELAMRMFHFYGPTNFLHRSIEFAERKVLDSLGLEKYSVESIATEAGISVTRKDSVNTEEFQEHIKTNEIDVILSVAAPEIFGGELLDAPRWGCLNVHTAKLPKYRGMLPTFWALYHGDDEIGVTVHTMDRDIDRGQIVRQTTFSVEDGETLDDVIKHGKRVGGRLAAKALDDIAKDVVSLEQMEGEESYYSFPTREERRKFQRRGGQLL